MKSIVPESKKISPFLVFFLIVSMQIGVGILGFQRFIAKTAGYDAWISIIITGLAIHIIMWMILKMLSITNGDFITIHTFVLGNKLGKMVSSIFILYLSLFAVTVLRSYIEIVQVWMFPDLETFWFALVFFLLVIYIVNGGFKTIAGIAFFSIVLPFYIAVMFVVTIPYSDFTNLLPIFDHSVKELLLASRDMSFTVLGFETILFYYPFIQEQEKSKKWVHLGLLFTTVVCLYLAVLTFAYFSEAQLQKNVWPTLTMWKIIKLPFVERFEYIGIANWFLIILPNVCICLWCASRLAKQLFSIRQKATIPTISILCFIATCFMTTREQINMVTDITAKVGFYFNMIYIPILFAGTLIAKKVRNREKNTT
ncbi:GerAB/ArcD/ProY family transporter [Bacillus sp. 7884-1]|uniref:GerAB/ArcD/ProY family transporter n=1 Tax=Bacillus sp. 7884-1 TaxID=2021693 RepID=UPI000BA50EDA|nr:GerAB/ArcD/ProY family transporter [Bacillus sp. 7884-1]PAE43063.1 spore gernimation protein GerB [Bacillus sp. 7884-1]